MGGYSVTQDIMIQLFMIDLSVSWSITGPVYKQPVAGSQALAGVPSAISSDGQNWIIVASDSCSLYNFQTSTMSTIMANTGLGFSGPLTTAATDPDTGLVYIPNGLKGANGYSMSSLDITAKKFGNIPMHPSIANDTLFSVAWSAAYKVMVYRGPSGGIFTYSPAKGWISPKETGSVPPPRASACFVSVDGGKRMIIAGGFAPDTKATFSDVYILDVATFSWTAGPSLAAEHSRDSAACGFSNGQLIMWGGYYTSPQAVRLVNTPIVFNLKTNNWTTTYTAPPKSTVSPSTSTPPKASDEPIGSPTPTTSTNDSGAIVDDSNNNKPSIVVILGSVIGALTVAVLIGGAFVYRSRSGKAKLAINNLGPSQEDTGGPVYTSTPGRVPYPLPPDFLLLPQPNTQRNPATVIEQQHEDPRSISVPVRQHSDGMGRPHEGTYGTQRYSQHPHASAGYADDQDQIPGGLYEMDNISQQAFINRRNPAEIDSSVNAYHVSDNRPQNPHTNVDSAVNYQSWTTPQHPHATVRSIPAYRIPDR
ncbi:hypothetical protein BGX31_010026 [Mortierella sp. GBA43]|nr:hypothetical protein BGX31_010026 [Mortierella sp. GBA43]